MTIEIGSICTIKNFCTRLWVAVEPVSDHLGEFTRWRLTCKQVDSAGRIAYSRRIANVNDVTVIHDPEQYAVGDTITWGGLDHLVLRDMGDEVELGVPEHRVKPHGYGVIRIPSGNTRVVSKANLLLAELT